MFLLVTILNIVAIITGLFCLRKGGPAFLYLALFIVSIAFINENFIVLHAKQWWGISRNVFYNLYSLAEIVVWFIIYYAVFNKSTRRLIIFCAAANIIYTVSELFFTGSFSEFHSNSYSVFSICSLTLSLLYIFSISLRDHYPLSRDPVFCLCCATVCFHSIFFLNLLTMLDPDYWQQEDAVYIFDTLQSLATCTYYLLICIAFIIFYCRSKSKAEHPAL